MVIIRQAKLSDVKAVAKVHVDSWNSTYEGIVPPHYLNTLSYEVYEKMWHDLIANEPLYVAQIGQEIVGFAKAGSNNERTYPQFESELYVLYILEDYQGKGIGKELLITVITHLLEQHVYSLYLYVLKDNSACQFYEKHGARLIDEVATDIGGKKLTECVYGWDNLRLKELD